MNLNANNFFYSSNGDKSILKFNKSDLTMMRENCRIGNIYKLLESTIVGDVALVKYNNNTSKL